MGQLNQNVQPDTMSISSMIDDMLRRLFLSTGISSTDILIHPDVMEKLYQEAPTVMVAETQELIPLKAGDNVLIYLHPITGETLPIHVNKLYPPTEIRLAPKENQNQ